MKTLFISAKIKSPIDKSKILGTSKQLPKNIAIAYSIQYQDFAYEVKRILSKKHKITKFIQVLGCSKPSFPKITQAILLIGDGRFHAFSLGFETKLPICILNNNQLEQISQKDVQILENRQKTAYLKFLNATEIGILVSTKPGQENLKRAIELKKKLNNKKPYVFISNNINIREFENFSLESWVNTACPRLDIDSSNIMNINRVNYRERHK